LAVCSASLVANALLQLRSLAVADGLWPLPGTITRFVCYQCISRIFLQTSTSYKTWFRPSNAAGFGCLGFEIGVWLVAERNLFTMVWHGGFISKFYWSSQSGFIGILLGLLCWWLILSIFLE